MIDLSNNTVATPNILVTGATGFIGKSLLLNLVAKHFSVSALVRHSDADLPQSVTKIGVADITLVSDWRPILKNIEIIVYIAARAHIMNDDSLNPLAEFRKVNTEATLTLARQAAQAGVKRFVFISSIGVNGNNSIQAYTELAIPNPQEPYAESKYEAEQGLLALAKETGMEVVIIRPPLVYGPGVKANFAAMIKWVNKGIPLPLGAVNNQRSFVALENLVSFITCCIEHPKAANEIFLISDGADVSTTELLRKVAHACGKKAWLLPVPVSLMTMAAKLIGKKEVANRLFGSLQVDSSKSRDLLAWKPVITMDEQLKKIAEVYFNEKVV